MHSVDAITTALHSIAQERVVGEVPPDAIASCLALQELVVRFDYDIAGAEVDSLAELVLRAQTLVILLLLDELYDVIRRDATAYCDLFTTQLSGIEEVVSLLFDSLGRIDRKWLEYRAAARDSDNVGVEDTRELLYWEAIRRGQSDMAALFEHPGLAHFLRIGVERASIGSACAQLMRVVKIRPRPCLARLRWSMPSNAAMRLVTRWDRASPPHVASRVSNRTDNKRR